eukprot:2336728-Prymnesium_polylepis.1
MFHYPEVVVVSQPEYDVRGGGEGSHRVSSCCWFGSARRASKESERWTLIFVDSVLRILLISGYASRGDRKQPLQPVNN